MNYSLVNGFISCNYWYRVIFRLPTIYKGIRLYLEHMYVICLPEKITVVDEKTKNMIGLALADFYPHHSKSLKIIKVNSYH